MKASHDETRRQRTRGNNIISDCGQLVPDDYQNSTRYQQIAKTIQSRLKWQVMQRRDRSDAIERFAGERVSHYIRLDVFDSRLSAPLNSGPGHAGMVWIERHHFFAAQGQFTHQLPMATTHVQRATAPKWDELQDKVVIVNVVVPPLALVHALADLALQRFQNT